MRLPSIMLFLLFGISSCITSFAQRSFYKNSVLSSLEIGEMPKFSDSIKIFFQKRNETATVLYHLVVDTTGFIKTYKVIPIYNIGNSIDSTCPIWQVIYETINQNIAKWKFKPNLWQFKDKKLETRLNKKAGSRPHGGYQFFFIFFTINSDIEHKPIFTDIFN